MAKIKNDLTGKTFGKLTVTGLSRRDKWGAPIWSCICECGKEVESRTKGLQKMRAPSCGCSPSFINDLTGKVFGDLTVLKLSHKASNGTLFWECSCTCGGSKKERSYRLTTGKTTNCGCHTRRRLELGDQVFGNLLVKKFVGFNKRCGAVWECVCQCGKGEQPEIIYSTSADLRKGVIRGCRLCRGDRWVEAAGTHGFSQQERFQITRFRLWRSIQNRAKRTGIPFTITPDDIVVPDKCPLLGVPFEETKENPGPNSPSLDKIIPSLGYIPGNVWVVSKRANWIKSDATLEELKMITANLEKKIDEIEQIKEAS